MKKVYLNTLTPEEIIKRLKAGEVVKFDGCSSKETTFRMIDGILVGMDEHGIQIGDNIFIEKNKNDYSYFEEEEKFEITETGFYKTRCGQKVYVSTTDCISFGLVYGWVENTDCSFYWGKDGKFYENKTNKNDIVAKWED